jgi:predicted alpha/beta hydrolase
VVICSGTGIPRGFYADYAGFLAGQGFEVVTLDYRGIGGSRPRRLRGFEATMRAWGEFDVDAALRWARAELRPERLLVVGHSAGGWLTALAPTNREVDGMIAVASMSGYWGHMRSPEKFRLALLWHLAPLVVRALGYLPGELGTQEDLPMGVALEWARWCRRRDYFFSDPTLDAAARLARLNCAVRAYQFDDDPWGTPAAVQAMLAGYTNATVELRGISPAAIGVRAVGHLGFFRRRVGARLWPETADWLASS